MALTHEEWLDIEQAATWLKVPVSAVSQAVSTGQIPAMKIGDYVRISRSALVAAASQAAPASAQAAIVATAPDALLSGAEDRKVPAPIGLIWERGPEEGQEFIYQWPRPNDEPRDDGAEKYDPVWNATISVHGHEVSVRVGESVRYDRGRLTVWLGQYPVAEFAETEDGLSWASLIKPDSRKVLKPGEPIPALYCRARVEPYRQVTGLSGSGVPNGLAVVIDHDDIRGAVHHPASRWLRRQNLPVEVA
jgi:excisionase family DNA binding protein